MAGGEVRCFPSLSLSSSLALESLLLPLLPVSPASSPPPPPLFTFFFFSTLLFPLPIITLQGTHLEASWRW